MPPVVFRQSLTSAVPSIRRDRGGFTLVEILIVIGIIAVLISILMSGASKAQEVSRRLACVNNVRALSSATLAYANEHRGQLPGANWASLEGANPNGWLYKAPNRGPDTKHREAGILWKYIGKNGNLYRCPSHEQGDGGGVTVNLTSYMINGAVCGYGDMPFSYFHREFAADAVLFWEATETGFNDGSSTPNEVNLSLRHNRHSIIGCFDGSAQQISREEWDKELNNSSKNRLWCAPNTSNGR